MTHPERSMDFTVTDTAQQRLELYLRNKPKEAVLRIAIVAGGCSGNSYSMKIVDAPHPGDKLVEGRVSIEPRSALVLAGSVLDWVDEDFKAGFHIENPKAKASCGCGKSFTT